MTDSILYFPYMRVPPAAWFTRALLYWDEVAAIIPARDLLDREALDPYTTALVAGRLLKRISPDEHHLPGLAAGFDQVLTADRNFQADRERGEEPTRGYTRIHFSKMGFEVTRLLEEQGLASPALPLGYWYDVESRTAQLYMAYLAVVLGRTLRMSPVTDQPEAIAILNGQMTGIGSSLIASERLQLSLIRSILPAPSATVPTRDCSSLRMITTTTYLGDCGTKSRLPYLMSWVSRSRRFGNAA